MIVPYNALLYLALIRPLFCIGAIVKPNWSKVRKKKKNVWKPLTRWLPHGLLKQDVLDV